VTAHSSVTILYYSTGMLPKWLLKSETLKSGPRHYSGHRFVHLRVAWNRLVNLSVGGTSRLRGAMLLGQLEVVTPAVLLSGDGRR